MEILTTIAIGQHTVDFGVVTTHEEREAVLAQRFRVYQREGYYRQGVAEDEDEYDREAVFFLARLRRTDPAKSVMVASARLIRGREEPTFKFPCPEGSPVRVARAGSPRPRRPARRGRQGRVGDAERLGRRPVRHGARPCSGDGQVSREGRWAGAAPLRPGDHQTQASERPALSGATPARDSVGGCSAVVAGPGKSTWRADPRSARRPPLPRGP